MELVTTHICKASDIGVHSNMFGGTMLALIDLSAGAYASQICDTQKIVTLKIDELIFKKPVKVGSILKVYGEVVSFGNTSVTLYVEVRKHNVYTGEQDIVTQTKIVFVRIDEDGKPRPIHQHVKERYWKRLEKFGKGLLTPEEKFRIGAE